MSPPPPPLPPLGKPCLLSLFPLSSSSFPLSSSLFFRNLTSFITTPEARNLTPSLHFAHPSSSATSFPDFPQLNFILPRSIRESFPRSILPAFFVSPSYGATLLDCNLPRSRFVVLLAGFIVIAYPRSLSLIISFSISRFNTAAMSYQQHQYPPNA